MVSFILRENVREESAGEFVVTLACEMSMVGLSPADGYPVAHGAQTTHTRALIPVSAMELPADAALRGDDAIDSAEGLPGASTGAKSTVGWTDDQDGGFGGDPADTLEDALEHGGVALLGPVAVAGFVGSIGEHNERRIDGREERLLHDFAPAEEERCFGAVDTGRLVGDA